MFKRLHIFVLIKIFWNWNVLWYISQTTQQLLRHVEILILTKYSVYLRQGKAHFGDIFVFTEGLVLVWHQYWNVTDKTDVTNKTYLLLWHMRNSFAIILIKSLIPSWGTPYHGDTMFILTLHTPHVENGITNTIIVRRYCYGTKQ